MFSIKLFTWKKENMIQWSSVSCAVEDHHNCFTLSALYTLWITVMFEYFISLMAQELTGCAHLPLGLLFHTSTYHLYVYFNFICSCQFFTQETSLFEGKQNGGLANSKVYCVVILAK